MDFENMSPVSYTTNNTPDFKWNWGAFTQNILFGFANKAWLTFLCFVPLLNIVWIFVCGAKGEKWAWESGEFANEQTFRAVMKSWNRAGLLCLIIFVVVIVFYLLMGVSVFVFLYDGLLGVM